VENETRYVGRHAVTTVRRLWYKYDINWNRDLTEDERVCVFEGVKMTGQLATPTSIEATWQKCPLCNPQSDNHYGF